MCLYVGHTLVGQSHESLESVESYAACAWPDRAPPFLWTGRAGTVSMSRSCSCAESVSTIFMLHCTCQVCNHFASFSYDCVLRHIGAVHSHKNGFRVRCGFDSCPRMLTNYHAFRHHLRKKHGFCLKTCSPTIGDKQLGERSNFVKFRGRG